MKDGGAVFADGATIEIDTINEATSAAGITIDGILLQDTSGITLPGTGGNISKTGAADFTVTAAVNRNLQLTVSGSGEVRVSGGDLIMNSNSITNLAEPSASGDAATKNYVDTVAQGLDSKESCRLKTIATLSAYTQSGTGIGATLTADANGQIADIDGFTPSVSNRILVDTSGTATGADRGIYTLTQLGDGSNPWILTRATDFDQDSEVTSGAFTFIEEGITTGGNGYVLATPDIITVDSTSMTFTQFSGAGIVIAGDGLTKSGNTLNVNPDTSSIEISGDQVRIASGAAGTGLSGGSGSSLSVDASQTQITAVGIIQTGTWASTITVDSISEETGAVGVTVDGVLLKDGGAVFADGASIEIDTINEATSAAGVTIDGTLLKDGGAVFADGASIEIDTINEATSAAGVTIDGTLLKDGGAVFADGASIEIDTINEATSAAGVTIDGTLLKDGGAIFADGASIEIDTINEATSAAGITIDGILLKDGDISISSGGLSLTVADSGADIVLTANDDITIQPGGSSKWQFVNDGKLFGTLGSQTIETQTGTLRLQTNSATDGADLILNAGNASNTNSSVILQTENVTRFTIDPDGGGNARIRGAQSVTSYEGSVTTRIVSGSGDIQFLYDAPGSGNDDGTLAWYVDNSASGAFTANGAKTITNSSGNLTVSAASALSLTSAAATTWQTTNGVLTVRGDDGLILAATSGALTMSTTSTTTLTSAGNILLDSTSGGITLASSGNITLGSDTHKLVFETGSLFIARANNLTPSNADDILFQVSGGFVMNADAGGNGISADVELLTIFDDSVLKFRFDQETTLRFSPVSTQPSGAGTTPAIVAGGLYYDDSTNTDHGIGSFRYYDGSLWQDIPPYREGSWTVFWGVNATGTGDFTLSAGNARYILIGRLCHIDVELTANTITSVGTPAIINLPFTSAVGNRSNFAIGRTRNITFTDSIGLRMTGNTIKMNIVDGISGGTGNNILDTNISSTAELHFSGTYMIGTIPTS